MALLSNLLRVALCFVYIGATFWFVLIALLLLLPSRRMRVYVTSLWAKSVGWLCLRMSGITLELVGRERIEATRPALFLVNHTSLFDVLLAMWLTPFGTTAVAKKEIRWFPFVGQIYLLSGSLRIDRRDRAAAVAGMAAQAHFIAKNRLSVVIWPEGTRSRSGRLLPLKKGFGHLALQTRLPIVPIVVSGAHRAWRVGGFRIRTGAEVRVEVGETIVTEGWVRERLDEHIASVAAAFAARLPDDQKPSAT